MVVNCVFVNVFYFCPVETLALTSDIHMYLQAVAWKSIRAWNYFLLVLSVVRLKLWRSLFFSINYIELCNLFCRVIPKWQPSKYKTWFTKPISTFKIVSLLLIIWSNISLRIRFELIVSDHMEPGTFIITFHLK